MKKSDKRSSDARNLPATENEPVDSDTAERAPKDYYYDDSTGYEIYEDKDEDHRDNQQTPEAEQEKC